MKIHSLSFIKKKELNPSKSYTSFNYLKSYNNKDKPKINNINLDMSKLDKLIKKNNEKKTISKNNNNENVENQLVPQKILKFNKKSLSLRKKRINEKNIKHYQNALMDNLDLIITNSNIKKRRHINNLNNSKLQNYLSNSKQPSLFNNFREYQKEYFSSVYNLDSSTNFSKYPSMDYNKIKSSTISPINKIIKENKKIGSTNLKNFPRPTSNILLRKNHGEIPIFLNVPVTFVKNFKSNSEKERDEKNSYALLRLRNFLHQYWDKRIELITEFFSRYQINDDEYYKLSYLENFAHYIYDNINDDTNVTKGIIETRIPMKEIIEKGINYKNYSIQKLKKMKSMSDINNQSQNNNKRKMHKTFSVSFKKKDNNEINYNKKKFIILKSGSSDHINKDLNMNNCFYYANYINNDYQISDREENKQILNSEKIEKYRKYLNRNYGVKVNNKFMRKYNHDEKMNYFNKRKVGTIDIPDKNNLVNNINKQSNFYKLKSTSFSIRNNKSIHNFTERDFKELINELKDAKQDYIYEKENDLKDKKKEPENVWIKMYEDVKKNKFEKHPELILKKKKKLLEYIIFQHIKERKEFEKDLLK